VHFRTPKISVIVPAFNVARFIPRCLDSIRNQSHLNLEVIAINDQSTDNTLEILETYVEKIKNFKIISSARKGLAGGARNLGLDHATGEFISFVDGDDWIDTNYYFHMLAQIQASNSDVCIAGVKREYDNIKNSSVRYQYNANNTIDGDFALALLTRVIDQDVSISAIVSNKLFRATFLRNNKFRFLENSLNEDDLFMFQIFLSATRVSLSSETYYHLYQRSNSASRSISTRHIDDLFDAFCRIKESLNQSGSYEKYRGHYYAFFDKCFNYLLESLKLSTPDEKSRSDFLVRVLATSSTAIAFDEYIHHCGSERLIKFFSLN
jgi:glycosyltransferase involved in cell wall biosynthesis